MSAKGQKRTSEFYPLRLVTIGVSIWSVRIRKVDPGTKRIG